jgi:hypothetical protein
MKARKVRDLMVPLSEYATVSKDASLHEAILALKEAHERFCQNRYKYTAILVSDENNVIVGKLSQQDVLRGLEPKYRDIGDVRSMSISGFTPEFLRSMVESHGLWQKPLADICRKAATLKVRDLNYTPVSDKCVRENATLDEATHQLIIGHHQNLLVTGNDTGDIVGVLPLSVVFTEICTMVEACKL